MNARHKTPFRFFPLFRFPAGIRVFFFKKRDFAIDLAPVLWYIAVWILFYDNLSGKALS